MSTRSLRLRVIAGVLVALTVVLVAAGFLVERALAAQLRGDLQQRLVDRVGYSRLLADEDLTNQELANQLSVGSDGVKVQVYDDGQVVTGVPSLPDTSGPPGPGAGGPGGPGAPKPPADVTAAVDVSADTGGISASLTLADGRRVVASGSTYDIAQTLQRLRTIELVAGAALLVVVAALLTGIVSVALRPLSRMTQLARGIARGGRGGRLHPDNPRTELGRTAAAFDEMLDALETAEREARTAAANATAAEERMRRLLADVSHELRTPVAALQARAESLLRENPPRERREDLAVGMVRDTRRAARLVDDLLLMNRLEQSPADQLRRRPLDLAALVRTVVAEQPAVDTGVSVTAHADGPVPVVGDPERLTQIVTNLVGNARRAVGAFGDVEVTAAVEGDRAVVAVSDTGPGVPDADRERVFDRFVRLDAARSRTDGGSGLGLPISRALARAHGGDVVCAPSERGATFVVTLPAAPPGAADDPSHPLAARPLEVG